MWLPTGSLGVLPLGLIENPASKRRLVDDYEIIYAPNLDALTFAQRQVVSPKAASLAAIVNPTEDLPGTEKEANVLASFFSSKSRVVLEKSAATTEAVLGALKGKSHWHFASHGTFSWENARDSALVMSGHNLLTVGQLLEADGLGRPRLVVLSACETGLYDTGYTSDEFIGLPGAFTALGAAGVLGTLWPVSDAATALLMARFYELHLIEGLAPSTALRRAQAWLRRATNTELDAYAANSVRLSPMQLAEVRMQLSEEGVARSRNAKAVEWTTDAPRSQGEPKVEKRTAKPFAHPYFWAAFIYTGL